MAVNCEARRELCYSLKVELSSELVELCLTNLACSDLTAIPFCLLVDSLEVLCLYVLLNPLYHDVLNVNNSVVLCVAENNLYNWRLADGSAVSTCHAWSCRSDNTVVDSSVELLVCSVGCVALVEHPVALHEVVLELEAIRLIVDHIAVMVADCCELLNVECLVISYEVLSLRVAALRCVLCIVESTDTVECLRVH